MRRRILALTFDDGPNTETTAEVLGLLEEYGAAASFFLVGKQITAETVPVLWQMLRQGCEICSHSFSHPALTQLSEAEILSECSRTARRIQEAAGVLPRFFRPPYLAVSDAVFDAVPLPMIGGYGVRDYDAAVSAEKRAARVLQLAADGRIILLHDAAGNTQTVEALRKILPVLRDEGYAFVTVSQLFAEKGTAPQPHERILYSYAGQTALYAAGCDIF